MFDRKSRSRETALVQKRRHSFQRNFFSRWRLSKKARGSLRNHGISFCHRDSYWHDKEDYKKEKKVPVIDDSWQGRCNSGKCEGSLRQKLRNYRWPKHGRCWRCGFDPRYAKDHICPNCKHQFRISFYSIGKR